MACLTTCMADVIPTFPKRVILYKFCLGNRTKVRCDSIPSLTVFLTIAYGLDWLVPLNAATSWCYSCTCISKVGSEWCCQRKAVIKVNSLILCSSINKSIEGRKSWHKDRNSERFRNLGRYVCSHWIRLRQAENCCSNYKETNEEEEHVFIKKSWSGRDSKDLQN